ncbi:MFS transporter [Microlunatus speluncae]|uniref:MFS transporter n=1 Tax=Microlunatus speluncae TaxID=2594267 RepID=UPI001FEBA8C8|nr:MFS transporter [Microlunatus speluncae]
MAEDVRDSAGEIRPESMGRVAVASFIGTTIEFFDFYAYGLAAALVLNKAFFPELDPVTGTLAAFSTYAVAFVSRPLGAALFGHFGDRVGRKTILIVSLLLMGGSTFLVGLLPGYASWGIAAPVVLVVLRFIQGIGLGGEWGGAALLATEHAPPGKRGFYAMFPQLGPAVGFILANLSFLGARLAMPQDQFVAWGWRIPFIASAVLILIGLYIRVRIAETPVFRRALARQEAASTVNRVPLLRLFRAQPGALLLGAGVMMIQYTLFYTSTTYLLSYGTRILGIGEITMLVIVLLAVVVLGLATAASSILSDRVGRRRLLVISAAVAIGWALLIFPLVDSGNLFLVWLALAGCLCLMGLSFGPMGAFLPELFPTRYRYSGAALSYSLGGVLGGALPPIIAVQLQANLGSWSIGIYIAIVAVISLGSVLALPETREVDLDAEVADEKFR